MQVIFIIVVLYVYFPIHSLVEIGLLIHHILKEKKYLLLIDILFVGINLIIGFGYIITGKIRYALAEGQIQAGIISKTNYLENFFNSNTIIFIILVTLSIAILFVRNRKKSLIILLFASIVIHVSSLYKTYEMWYGLRI